MNCQLHMNLGMVRAIPCWWSRKECRSAGIYSRKFIVGGRLYVVDGVGDQTRTQHSTLNDTGKGVQKQFFFLLKIDIFYLGTLLIHYLKTSPKSSFSSFSNVLAKYLTNFIDIITFTIHFSNQRDWSYIEIQNNLVFGEISIFSYIL